MLIQKGGITRNVSEGRLYEYTAKGYAPVAVPELAENPPADAPAEKGGKRQPEKVSAKE